MKIGGIQKLDNGNYEVCCVEDDYEDIIKCGITVSMGIIGICIPFDELIPDSQLFLKENKSASAIDLNQKQYIDCLEMAYMFCAEHLDNLMVTMLESNTEYYWAELDYMTGMKLNK